MKPFAISLTSLLALTLTVSCAEQKAGQHYELGPNPIITHMYSADPSARVFGDTLWVYPSHDKDDAVGFSMEDYHAYSTVDMVNFTDHGMIFNPIEQTVWIHKRDGLYYISYSNSPFTGHDPEIVYGVSDNVLGPYEYKGRILAPVSSGTNHHSIVKYGDDWFIFWHDARLSREKLDFEHHPELKGCCSVRRCVNVDKLYYNEDGTIIEVEVH